MFVLLTFSHSFIVEDSKYNYITGRFPNDVDLMSEAAVKMVKSIASG